MIYHRKEVPMPKKRRKYKRFSLSGYTGEKGIKNGNIYPEYALNFQDCVDGTLRGGVGLKRVFSNNPFLGYDVERIYYYADEGSVGELIFFADGKAYSLSLTPSADGGATQPTFLADIDFQTTAEGVQFVDASGKNYLALFTDKGVYLYDGATLSLAENSVACTMGCTHRERLFVVDKSCQSRILFSAPFNPQQWGEEAYATGSIEVSPEQGEIYAIFSVEKKLFILRREGCSVLTLEGESCNVMAYPIPASVGKVMPRTAQRVNKEMVFLSSDGLYKFDGVKVKKVAPHLTRAMRFTADGNFVVSVWGGYYVLCYDDLSGGRKTLFVDVENERGWISENVFSGSTYNGEKSYLLADGDLMEWSDNDGATLPTQTVWQSGYQRFNLGYGKKTVKKIALRGTGSVRLTIRSDSQERKSYVIALRENVAVFPKLQGEVFNLEIEGLNQCVVREIEFCADLFGEGGAV